MRGKALVAAVVAAVVIHGSARPRYGLWSLSMPNRRGGGFLHALQLEQPAPQPEYVPPPPPPTTTELPPPTFPPIPVDPVGDLERDLEHKLGLLLEALKFRDDLQQLVESAGKALVNAILREATDVCLLDADSNHVSNPPNEGELRQSLHRAVVDTVVRLEPVLKAAGILGLTNHMQSELVQRAVSVLGQDCSKVQRPNNTERRLRDISRKPGEIFWFSTRTSTSPMMKFAENVMPGVKILDLPLTESLLESILKVAADGASRRDRLSHDILGFVGRSIDASIAAIVEAVEHNCESESVAFLEDQTNAFRQQLNNIAQRALDASCPPDFAQLSACRLGVQSILQALTQTADLYRECRFVAERVVGMQYSAASEIKALDARKPRRNPDADVRFTNDTEFVTHLLTLMDDEAVRLIPSLDADSVPEMGLFNFAGIIAENLVKTVMSTCVRIVKKRQIDGFPTLKQALVGTATSLTELLSPTLVRIGVPESINDLGDAFVAVILDDVGPNCENVPEEMKHSVLLR